MKIFRNQKTPEIIK